MTWQTLAYASLAVSAGALFSVQTAANALLGRGIGGPVAAASISFAVGLVVLLCLNAAIFRQWPSVAELSAQPAPLLWIGGATGVTIMSANLFLAPRLGVAASLCFLIAGQLVCALAIDRFGLFGFGQRDLTAGRVGGVLLVLVGAVLVRLT